MPKPGLKLYNSLTRSLEEFVPRDGPSRAVSWYSCGPTVYDASHMGHARSYISFDILRRVIVDYFGYDVFFVMNITDIDDKIIKRARVEHLFAEYVASSPSTPTIVADVSSALESYTATTSSETDPDKKQMREKIGAKIRQALADASPELLQQSKDVLYDYLDTKNVGRKFENEIFAKFARKWEEEYFVDMSALNILAPDVLTRVSEYVEEIVTYIQKIIENGYAYEANGSVYFDVGKFKASKGHRYAKLVPEAVGDEKALMEGEGELSSKVSGEKKAAADFALWKNSRPGEPSWSSPWGQGRPGWHIECSAMASAIVGKELDIHTGGVDLKFPHHDNELAQSEAYFESEDWVRYFLHSGHLTIAGCKMSKSLKNFVTIKDALKSYTAAQLRLTFLLHGWGDTLDYSPQGMESAIHFESKVSEFFLNVKDAIRISKDKDPYPKWTPEDLSLQQNFETAKSSVHAALCDNIDTRSACNAIRELISAANVYLSSKACKANAPLLKSMAQYVTKILQIFGVIPSSDGFGFVGKSSEAGADVEGLVLPFLEVLSDFREKVRGKAKGAKDTEILQLCDEIRDMKLPSLGVRMEDREGCPTIIKYVGAEAMAKEREQKEKLEAERAAEKAKKKAELAKAAAEKEAQKKIPPSQLFLKEVDKYSTFNDVGMPTHDAQGTPLTKSAVKKLEKLYATQKKLHEEYLKSQS